MRCPRRFVATAGAGFDHLFWCVGTDLRAAAGGAPEVCKAGVYGSF